MMRYTTTASLVGIAALAGLAAMGGWQDVLPGDPYAGLPSQITIDAVIRDFKAKGTSGGHNDFQAYSGTTTVGLVKPELDADGKPQVHSLRGQTISTEFKDRLNRPINPALFNPDRGDIAGSLTAGGTGNGLYSAESFAQWYRDVPGVNVSKVVPLVLRRQANSNRYVFDSAVDEPYKSRGGFFPINGELYGNSGTNSAGLTGNFHFTTEINTEFEYRANQGQTFKFTGDDDVWVFIDGRLVIDLGGLHPKREQFLELDRLDWLANGRTYKLQIFHAERRTNQSNFRMETTLQMRAITPPAIGSLFD